MCGAVSAGIDVAGRYHIAAECDGSIHYFASNGLGSWTERAFVHPADRLERSPQIAFQGNVVYIAYTRITLNPGCGGGDEDLGVYVRSRNLNGAWSAGTRIGSVADHLQSFRVDGSTLHATVANASRVYYETLNGSTYHRYLIPDAIQSSLRIGSDGRARIAYDAGSGLRYAVFTGSRFSTSKIAGTDGFDQAPVLALGAGDRPHVVWTRTVRSGGCAGPEPPLQQGTYYATNASGAWASQRITRSLGETSLQVDDVTGRVHVLVNGETGLVYYTKPANGAWAHSRVGSVRSAFSPVIRLDPATGTLLVVYVGGPNAAIPRIYAVTKP